MEVHDQRQPPPTRRELLKQAASSGLVVINYLQGDRASAKSKKTPSSSEKASPLIAGRHHRLEGRAKVTGAKLYGRDFRAKDLSGWPKAERVAVILRTPLAGKILRGIDTARLRTLLGDVSLITGDDLARWGVEAAPPFLMPTLYVRSQSVPDYLGQPIALLSFKSVAAYLEAKPHLTTLSQIIQWGDKQPPPERPPYGTSRFVYYTDRAGQEEFSYVKDGPWTSPWEAPDQHGSPNAKASYYIEKIKADLSNSAWRVFRKTYETQSTDPMFMEPECGLAWYDAARHTLHLTLGTQSPQDDGDAVLSFFHHAKTLSVKKVVINCCYPGGGFGGRDGSDFPLHLAIAAVSEPNVTHRIIHSRFEQFQAGIKRHPAKLTLELAIDADGRFQALLSNLELDGGGQNNYSFAVQNVGARNATSAYRFPRSCVESIARASTAIPAGSVRGFGSFQSTFALECLIDEAAHQLGIDPIDLRLRNLVSGIEPVHTGTIVAHPIRSDEVLKAAQNSRIWQQRHTAKTTLATPQTLYGVGLALGVKSFGKNPGDAVVAGLTMDPHGRLLLLTNSVDMGNGTATTLPLSIVDLLGRPADDIKIGATTEFDPLQLAGPKAKDEADQEKLAKNPFWVPYRAMSTAASAGAYHMRHAVREAARVILQCGLWPAACAILGLKGEDRNWNPAHITWHSEGLVYRGMRPIPFAALAKKAYSLKLATGALIHAFYRSRWAQATFTIKDASYRAEIDALAIRWGSGRFAAIPRTAVDFPPFRTLMAGANRYTPYAIVIGVEVSRTTGEVKVVEAESFLACGPITLAPIVEGQMEGAFAMGVGQALTESFPIDEAGPGQGDWNLHRYRVPLASDCALGKTKFNILPPHPEEDPRGMAEVTFNPIPAAIVNAIADATGKWLRRLPLTSDDVKAALA